MQENEQYLLNALKIALEIGKSADRCNPSLRGYYLAMITTSLATSLAL